MSGELAQGASLSLPDKLSLGNLEGLADARLMMNVRQTTAIAKLQLRCGC